MEPGFMLWRHHGHRFVGGPQEMNRKFKVRRGSYAEMHDQFEPGGPWWAGHDEGEEPPERVEHMHVRAPWAGRGGHGFRHGGPWGRRGGPRVGRGDVRAAILLLLAERPLHGYQIIQEIGEWSGGLWRPSPGSVYPALQLLEDEGLVRAEQESDRRVFHLTGTGRAYVEAHRKELVAARNAVTGAMDEAVLDLRDLHEQVGAALMQVARAGTPAQVAEARHLLTGVRRQLYRILAGDAPSSSE